MIALVDCNNFYASCERVFNPAIAHSPIVVLSNNDGCVIARSEEARAIGIEMGAPAFMMEDMLAKNKVQVFSSNYTLYGDLSERVQRTLQQYTPDIETYSIDEAFLDLTSFKHLDFTAYGKTIRERIKTDIGIPVSVGIAPSKTLAKMANKYAKKHCRDTGVYCLDTPEKIQAVLQWTKIEEVWGIGSQHSRRLGWMGIKTAAGFIQLPVEWVKKNMSVTGERLLNELKGIPSIEWEDIIKPKKGICTARSFGKLLSEKKDIQEAIANYAAACARKLRLQNGCAATLQVLIQTNVHRTADKQYSRSVTLKLPMATSSSRKIISVALRGLEIIFREGYQFKKAGVIVMDIVPEEQVQQSLFETPEENKKDAQVMKSLDNLNKRFGKDLVRFASQGYGKKWKLRQMRLSPCYSTNVQQLLTVKI